MISTTRMLGFSFARRNTRRCVLACYWFLMLLSCYGFQRHLSRSGFGFMTLNAVFIFIVFTGLLGGVRGGGPVRAFRGVRWIPWQTEGRDYNPLTSAAPQSLAQSQEDPHGDVYAPLDERETRERDRVHFIAYTLARWGTLAFLSVYLLLGALDVAWLGRVGPCLLFLLTMILWSLPQSLILWTEPDMEEAQ
jgi:hypothetical protein